jgi:hypothetical protein
MYNGFSIAMLNNQMVLPVTTILSHILSPWISRAQSQSPSKAERLKGAMMLKRDGIYWSAWKPFGLANDGKIQAIQLAHG